VEGRARTKDTREDAMMTGGPQFLSQPDLSDCALNSKTQAQKVAENDVTPSRAKLKSIILRRWFLYPRKYTKYPTQK